ncbi:unnamed protein product [Danaus chrysippus]|uniref:Elongation of very long chain fatty acids protein n=1 Tax=Danaus chrysippus TaxID=151541 RepID=A0A8J2VYN4_9NEOP|nr:unnamed protein product [Danaus chrysippus]
MGIYEAWGWRYKWVCEPVDQSRSRHAMKMATLVYMYYLLKVLDLMDTVQFLFCVVHMTTIVFVKDCAYPRWVVAMYTPQNLFMLILFIDFYIKSYVKKPKEKSDDKFDNNQTKIKDNVKEQNGAMVDSWFMMSSPFPILSVVLLYLLFIRIGPRIMKNRPPLEINKLISYYNAAQVVLATMICIKVFKLNLFRDGILYAGCRYPSNTQNPMLQFVLMLLYCAWTHNSPRCQYATGFTYFIFINVTIFLILFLNFYYKNYKIKMDAKKEYEKTQNGVRTNKHTNGINDKNYKKENGVCSQVRNETNDADDIPYEVNQSCGDFMKDGKMYCYVCVIYLIIIATAHPPKDREVSKTIEKRSIFHDVIQSLKIRNQLPEDIDEDNNVGQNYELEDERLHLPSDLDFLPRRNDRIEMPTLKYRFPKTLNLNDSAKDEKSKKEIVLYVNAPSDNDPSTSTPRPKPQKTTKPKPKPGNRIKTSHKNNSNVEGEDKPFSNSMAGQSQIGNREYQTIVKPTVIINLRGSVSNRERDIVIEKRRLENETVSPQNIFNIHQGVALDMHDTKSKNKPNDKISVIARNEAMQNSKDEDMIMCETSSNKEMESTKRKSSNLSEDEPDTKLARAILDRVDGPVYYQADTEKYLNDDSTLDIVEKIKAINNGLTKPRREQINYNLPYAEKSQGIDQELLKKLQDIIASGKIKSHSLNLPEDSNISNDDHQIINSRALKFNPEMLMGNELQTMPLPYIINLPVVVTPNSDLVNKLAVNNNFKSVLPNDAYTTRQQSPFLRLPFFQNFNFEWPLTQSLFPVLIKNPFVAFSQGGGWDNFIEYGQSADVCNRKQKSGHSRHSSDEIDLDQDLDDSNGIRHTSLETKTSARKSRALKKRTVADKSPNQEIEESKSGKKIYVTNQTPTRRATKKPNNVEKIQDSKNDDSGGDLRFPFGDFNWFGDKKPAVPLPPGFFINRLRVRKGGVAIAGPGGVATAGRGGTAIVGPGGLAYTQPGGLAVAGPHARIVALPESTDINDVLSSLQENDSSVPAASQPIREGKLVATGPVIYYHPTEQPSQP